MFPVAVVQLNNAPAVLEEPDNVTLVTVQLSALSVPALATGTAASAVTTALSAAVQPLGPVTVRMYVPALLTTGVAVFAPLTMFPVVVVQLNNAPDVLEEPDNVTLVTVQLSVLSVPALATGTVASTVTTALSVAVQPLGPVTVKTYVPALLTTGVAVFAPLTMFPVAVVQLNDAPAVLDEPDNVTLVIVQLSALSVPALAVAGVTVNVAKPEVTLPQ